MIMKKIYFTPFIIFLLLSSCHKDYLIERDSSIIIGDVSDEFIISTLESPDTLNANYNQSDELAIDLNNDGQNDILITSWLFGSPGQGADYGSYIEPINNKTSILSFEKKDTVFYFQVRDTVYHSNFTEIFNGIYYESVNRHNSDSIHTITKRSYPLFLKEQDVINSNESWENDQLTFRATGYRGGQQEQTNDDINHIIYYDRIYNNLLYGDWPIDEIKYIGIKYNDQLGWIKVKLESYRKVIIYEYALQK